MARTSPQRLRLIQIAVVAGIVFIAIQFIRPTLTNPPVTADLQAPPQVKQILKNSCYSCHSNETKLPWFDEIAPANWIAVSDVKEGRKHLNFSEIGKLPAAQQKGLLFEAISNIQMGAMPLPSYRRVHPGSGVTLEQLAILKSWLAPPSTAAAADPAAADAGYQRWIQASSVVPDVRPTPNGIEFMPDYRNWKAISSTDRFDNHTMREILGNDIAVKAIAEHHINPWPDGTAFAKVAWQQLPDGKGTVRTGAFVQVEFMIRDSSKYASTKGWGWARWRGADLVPYGKDAAFTSECVNCHNPVRNSDYVFTLPIGGQQ
ncbi:MAG: heme-binding domain-containing protein [Edaphobacter sp.]